MEEVGGNRSEGRVNDHSNRSRTAKSQGRRVGRSGVWLVAIATIVPVRLKYPLPFLPARATLPFAVPYEKTHSRGSTYVIMQPRWPQSEPFIEERSPQFGINAPVLRLMGAVLKVAEESVVALQMGQQSFLLRLAWTITAKRGGGKSRQSVMIEATVR